MCVCIQSDIALPRATCGYRLGDQYFCSMPHVYVLHLLIHTCNVSIDRCRLQHMQCFYCLGGSIVLIYISISVYTHTPNIFIGKHFRMWEYMFESMGGGRVGEGWGEPKGNL